MKLSEKILELRKQHGMPQEMLAEKLNVSRQAISRWESDSALPDANNILQLSKLFGVSADYLLNEDYVRENACRNANPDRHADKSRKIIGLCIAGFGLLCNFIIYVLSRFIKVMVPHAVHENGETWYTYSSNITAYSYKHFIENHNLEFLTALFWVMLASGLCIAFIRIKTIKKVFSKSFWTDKR